MKTIKLTLLTLLVSLSAFGFATLAAYSNGWRVGSDRVSTAKKDLADFRYLEFKGTGEVQVVQGDENTIEITAPEKYLDAITTSIDKETLTIEEKFWEEGMFGFGSFGFFSDDTKIKYTLTVKDLDSVTLVGTGEIIIPSLINDSVIIIVDGTGSIRVDRVECTGTTEVSLYGVGSIKLNHVITEDADIVIEGTGSIAIKEGSAERQSVVLNGVGSFDGKNFETAETSASVNGTGSVSVNATEKLEAFLDGLGSIDYYGDPEVKSSVDGLGSINHKN